MGRYLMSERGSGTDPMAQKSDFPNERLRWMDDLLAELEKFSMRYDLDDLRGDLAAARLTLRAEAERVNARPDHPVHSVRGQRDH